MPRHARALVAALAPLAILLALVGAPSASAAPTAAPVPGTEACTTLVKLDPLVVAAQAAVNAAPADLPDDALADLKAALDVQTKAAIARLCTGVVNPDPTTTTTPPTSSTTPTAQAPIGDERDCTDFATRQDAQDFYDSRTTPANPDPSKLDRDGDGVACEPGEVNTRAGGTSGGSSTIDIDPTADDGTTAGGTQVSEVPEGSASTGA